MFNSIRNKLMSVVQEGINLNINIKSTIIDQNTSQQITKHDNINYFAGCKLLKKFQNDWEAIHSLSEENAKNAEVVADFIDKIQTENEVFRQKVNSLNVALTNIPFLVTSIEACTKRIGEIGLQFRNIEKDLFQLENLIEVLEMEDRKSKHCAQLELYKERKLANMEKFRSNLAIQHTQNVKKFEMVHNKELKERQQAFQEAFHNDMLEFKTQGKIERVHRSTPPLQTLSLEEVDLEQSDTDLLDEFLNQ